MGWRLFGSRVSPQQLTALVKELRIAIDHDDAQALEDTLAKLTAAQPALTPEGRQVAQENLAVGTRHFAKLQEAWATAQANEAATLGAALLAAAEQARQAIDTKMRLAALDQLRAATAATEAHITATFTSDTPCVCADKGLMDALADAELWHDALAWTNRQRKAWITVAQALVTAVQVNADGAGKDSFDSDRLGTRTALHAAVHNAERLLQSVPATALNSKDHVMLECQWRRATVVLADLDRFWAEEWKAREALRPWVPDRERGQCQGCEQPLGWLRLRRRHHCRQCGEIFCHRCLQRTKAIPALAYNEPAKVCGRCYAVPPPAPPKLLLPEALRWVVTKTSIYKATALSELY